MNWENDKVSEKKEWTLMVHRAHRSGLHLLNNQHTILKDDSMGKLLKFGHTLSRNLDFIINCISHTCVSTPTLLAQYTDIQQVHAVVTAANVKASFPPT